MWKLDGLSLCVKTFSPHCGLQSAWCRAAGLMSSKRNVVHKSPCYALCDLNWYTMCGDDRGIHLTAVLHQNASVGTVKQTAAKPILCIFSFCDQRDSAFFHFLWGCQNHCVCMKVKLSNASNPRKTEKEKRKHVLKVCTNLQQPWANTLSWAGRAAACLPKPLRQLWLQTEDSKRYVTTFRWRKRFVPLRVAAKAFAGAPALWPEGISSNQPTVHYVPAVLEQVSGKDRCTRL